jgi:hypothetical protein
MDGGDLLFMDGGGVEVVKVGCEMNQDLFSASAD